MPQSIITYGGNEDGGGVFTLPPKSNANLKRFGVIQKRSGDHLGDFRIKITIERTRLEPLTLTFAQRHFFEHSELWEGNGNESNYFANLGEALDALECAEDFELINQWTGNRLLTAEDVQPFIDSICDLADKYGHNTPVHIFLKAAQ